MIKNLSHVSIVVPSLDAAARRLSDTYGLAIGEIQVNEQQGVRMAYVDLGNAKIELMEPSRADSPVAKFLERNPKGGIHHFCLGVDSVDTTRAELTSKGAQVLGDGKPQFNVHGERIAFVHPKDFLGTLVELEEPHHDKNNQWFCLLTDSCCPIISPKRFKYLFNTIRSVKEQTYSNIEIIVINDCSTEKEYYEYDWKKEGIIIVNLEKNTKLTFGYACAGFVRNKGIEKSSGKYVAFCDDDDIWFPKKIELQIKAMVETGCEMSTADGLIGNGIYDSTKLYKKYNAEHYYNELQSIYRRNKSNLLDNGFPYIWRLEFLKIHNCVICSSVLMKKELLNKLNNMKCIKNGEEDYDCWIRALQHTNIVYVKDICFYYDTGHGNGQNY